MKLNNLKRLVLPTLTFIIIIISFVGLQSFGPGPKGNGFMRVELIGINNSNCTLVAIPVNGGTALTLSKTGVSPDGNGLYYRNQLNPKDVYDVKVCFQNDGGAVQVIVKGEGEDNMKADQLDPSPNACD